MARVIPGQGLGVHLKGSGVGACAVLPCHGGRKLTFLQEHSGIGVTLPAGGRYAEHAGHIARRSLVQAAEHAVDGQHQIIADGGNHPLIPALIQPVKQNVQRIFNQFFIHGGQHAAAVNAAGGCAAGIGQFFHLDSLPAALCTAPQKVVTGNIIVIRNLHHKFKAAFPDAFLIMGKLRLADAKLLRRLFLGNAPLFAQQGNDAVKFHCHLVAILHTLPERSAQRPHRVCATSPGRRGRTFRRFLQHLRGRHAPAVLFSALRVCTAACRLTPCRACGR